MQYKIYGEVLLPGINYTDMVSVFEEHRICRKLGLISQHHLKEVTIQCVYSVCMFMHGTFVCSRMVVWVYMEKMTEGLYSTVSLWVKLPVLSTRSQILTK